MTLALRIHLLSAGVGTVTNLARRTGIERTKLNRALNGDVQLKADEQRRVADVLQLRADEVFPTPDARQAAIPAA